MFGERCTLCGGKLDDRKRCKECGLDNSKSERYYKINESACDHMPMTHVHEEEYESSEKKETPECEKKQAEPKTSSQADAEPKTYHEKAPEPKAYSKSAVEARTYPKTDTMPGTYRSAQTGQGSFRWIEKNLRKGVPAAQPDSRQKKEGWTAKLVSVFVILCVAGTILGEIGFGTDYFTDSDDGYERPDPYEALYDTGDELPVNGSYEEFHLPAGKYIVGVHLPAGDYTADVTNDYDAVRVDDIEHSIFLYESPAMEENYLNDLRLFDGALVEIRAEEPVVLTTENAQETVSLDNPLTKSYEFSKDTTKVAGVDFEAGVYDLRVTDGYGSVEIQFGADGEAEEEGVGDEVIILGYGFTDGTEYRNVILPEGAEVILEDSSADVGESFQIAMTPSPQIASTDYLQTYEEYYR